MCVGSSATIVSLSRGTSLSRLGLLLLIVLISVLRSLEVLYRPRILMYSTVRGPRDGVHNIYLP